MDIPPTCSFETSETEMFRDQLLERVVYSRIKKELLHKQNLSLDKAIAIATQMEAAINQANNMNENKTNAAGLKPEITV